MIRCAQCGARKNRATDPCIYCGAGSEQNNRTKGKVLILSILIIALVASCVLLLTGLVRSDDSAEYLVDTWISAVNEDDAEMLSTIFPQIHLDGTNVIPDFVSNYLRCYRDEMEGEFGDDFRMSASILSTTFEDSPEGDLLAELYEEADLEVQQSKSLDIELTLMGSKKTETETITINIIKIDGEWYFDILDSYFLDF